MASKSFDEVLSPEVAFWTYSGQDSAVSGYPPERRKDLRVPVAARVKIQEGNREEVWFTEDISEGGLFLKTDKPPFAGSVIELEISLPNFPDLIKLKGEVVRRHEGLGCGIRFTRVTAVQKKAIRNFIESAEPK